ncbi:Transposon Ty3-G Gag-Pol polyprotein [Sesamum angolense]|uniref:Transposon Ty3-G Gag-Pol polyprotein n=1 Tax=Sesamum angolense TaxID=2727404 RepID=A0AAE1WBJ7_9LAMI|nr:Transposon Ty3-G Gag-Pol polyprotein [Sesamum angolense]
MFFWGKLKEDVVLWIQSCDVCQKAKAERVPYRGLLQPRPVPHQAWSSVSMDFVEGLSKSEGRNCIMVVVDRLTKYSHFLALTHPFSAELVARIFMDNVYKLHGFPTNIVTDRDKIFTSSFWKELFKLLGTNLNLSTAYHPQSDGQTERVNQCVENYLCCMCHLRPSQWNKWLSLVEYWYNTNFHTGLKLTPFQALYGYVPGPVTIDPYIPTSQPENRIKAFADKHRTERSFEVGDEVYLKLHPYKQSSVQLRRNMKLAPKYYGPFRILAKVGPVAYRLAMPPTSVPQVLVQWINYSPSEATWEDYYDIVARFPDFSMDRGGTDHNRELRSCGRGEAAGAGAEGETKAAAEGDKGGERGRRECDREGRRWQRRLNTMTAAVATVAWVEDGGRGTARVRVGDEESKDLFFYHKIGLERRDAAKGFQAAAGMELSRLVFKRRRRNCRRTLELLRSVDVANNDGGERSCGEQRRRRTGLWRAVKAEGNEQSCGGDERGEE